MVDRVINLFYALVCAETHPRGEKRMPIARRMCRAMIFLPENDIQKKRSGKNDDRERYWLEYPLEVPA
jgi:hypothetical protein